MANKGASITFVRTTGGQIIGGFMSVNTTGGGTWVADPYAFIFSISLR